MECGDAGATKSVFGVPSLIRKSNRYMDEDFSLSPPSDETGFFHLRFGMQSHKAPESMYDRINKELGLTIETSTCHVTSNGFKESTKSVTDAAPVPIVCGPGGIVLETVPNSYPKLPSSSVFPDRSNECSRITIPVTIQERRESVEIDLKTEDFPFTFDKSEVLEDSGKSLRRAQSGPPTRKTSLNLTETLQSFNITSSHPGSIASLTHSLDEDNCYPTAALKTSVFPDAAAITRQRKKSAPPSLNPMAMAPQKSNQVSNFFFTGGLFSSTNISTPSLASECPDVSTSSALSMKLPQFSQITPSAKSEPASPVMQRQAEGSNSGILNHYAQKLDQRAQEPEALEPKPKMGKRRPKPSVLREMNFWAPQSM